MIKKNQNDQKRIIIIKKDQNDRNDPNDQNEQNDQIDQTISLIKRSE